MSLVGRCLEQGWGVPADPIAARSWYRRSAEAGYFRGQFNWASALAEAGEVDQARAWFEAALDGAPDESRRAMLKTLTRSRHAPLRLLATTDGDVRCW